MNHSSEFPADAILDNEGDAWFVRDSTVMCHLSSVSRPHPVRYFTSAFLRALLESSRVQRVRADGYEWFLEEGIAHSGCGEDSTIIVHSYLTRDFVAQLLKAFGGPPPMQLMVARSEDHD